MFWYYSCTIFPKQMWWIFSCTFLVFETLCHYCQAICGWLKLVYSIWKKTRQILRIHCCFWFFWRIYCQLRLFKEIAAVLNEVILSEIFFDWKLKICRLLRFNCLVWPNMIFINYQIYFFLNWLMDLVWSEYQLDCQNFWNIQHHVELFVYDVFAYCALN